MCVSLRHPSREPGRQRTRGESVMSQAEKASEPSMEEILSSIRKIISEDPVAKVPAVAPPLSAAAGAAPSKPTPAPTPNGLLASLGRAAAASLNPGLHGGSPPAPAAQGLNGQGLAAPGMAGQGMATQAPTTTSSPAATSSPSPGGPGQSASAKPAADSLDDILGLADGPVLVAVSPPVAVPTAKPSLSLPSWMTQKPAPAPQAAVQPQLERPALRETQTATAASASQPTANQTSAPITLPPQSREAPLSQPAASVSAFDGAQQQPSRSDFGAVVPGRSAAAVSPEPSAATPPKASAPQTGGPRLSDFRPDAFADRLNGGMHRAQQIPLPAASAPEPNGRDDVAVPSAATVQLPRTASANPAAPPAAADLQPEIPAKAPPASMAQDASMPAANPEAVLKPSAIPEPVKAEAPTAAVQLPLQTISAPLANARSATTANKPAMNGPVVNAPTDAPAAATEPTPAAAAVTTARPDEPTRTMEDTVAELLRPMLRQWLDTNMPRVVEKALRVELAASAQPKPDAAKH